MFSLLFALLVVGMSVAAVMVALAFVTKVAFKVLLLPILAVAFVLKAVVVLAVGVVFVALLIPVAIVIGLIAAPFAIVGAVLS